MLRRMWVCPVCRTETDTPDRRGHVAIEGALYLAWIVPGLVYSVWRRARDPDLCPTCGYFPMVRKEAMSALVAQKRESRPCPWCAEEILAQAIVCKHCGRDVPRAAS
jgi:rubrerythrin